MTWVRLDDQFPENPKIASISNDALALWVVGLAYCNRNLTDGFIPSMVAMGQLRWCEGNTEIAIKELELNELWQKTHNGWLIHDFRDYQPSKASVLAERDAARERMRNFRRSSGEVRANNRRSSLTPVPVPVPKSKSKPLAATPRERDILWDTLVEIFGTSAQGLERGKWNTALKSLRASQATPETLRAAAATYATVFPGATMTAMALATNWTSLTAKAKPPEQLAAESLRDRIAQQEGAR